MKKYLLITLIRTVKKSLGRYLALLAIVLLGVGFFAGLKNTKPLMISSAEEYLTEHRTFDYQLVSSLGLGQKDLKHFSDLDFIEDAEGSFSTYAHASFNGNNYGAKVLTVTERLNTLTVVSGRMPENSNECVADANKFSEKDLGSVINLTSRKDGDSLDGFSGTEYTIVGIVRSPLFISHDRGSSDSEVGALDFFVYLSYSACNSPRFSEVYLKANFALPQLGKAYRESVAARSEELKSILESRVSLYADELKALGIIPDVDVGTDAGVGFASPIQVHILTQKENMGLARYTQDTGIVDGIANIFPAFFALVAALVCLSTVSRMVFEESVQIGTLKALGYSDLSIAAKYILYSLSAGMIGSLAGFFIGTYGFPKIITTVYRAIYRFCDYKYTFSPKMLFLCLGTVSFGLLGVTLAAGMKTMGASAASVMRPKAPKAGKRVLAERLPFLWKRLSFFRKVTIRNMILNKKRIAMTMIGVGGCTALLVAGFGVRDNVVGVLDDQYGGIFLYDLSVNIREDSLPDFPFAENCCYAYYCQSSFTSAGGTDNIRVICCMEDDFSQTFLLKDRDKTTVLPLPRGNAVLLSRRMADKWQIRKGDDLHLTLNGKAFSFTVEDIFNNYTADYIIADYSAVSEAVKPNTAYLTLKEGIGKEEAEELLKKNTEEVISFQFVEEAMEQFRGSLSSMNYVVLVLIFCSGALAFIVLYNLTNINIMERQREIATVQVLGFYPKETSAYILRENAVLAAIGGLAGLAGGRWLSDYIISNLVSDGLRFNNVIRPQSYLYAFVLTLFFSLLTNRLMNRKIQRINMAEALKSVE